MRIAICLYGQPRDYKLGYYNISNFLKKNNQHDYDFFIHCWGDDNVILGFSPWRKIPPKNLLIKNMTQIKKDIIGYYSPCKVKFQKPIEKFDLKNIENSTAYKNSTPILIKNIHNTLSQIYSRNSARDLLGEYITEKKVEYDMVITMRIDYAKSIPFELNNIDTQKIYVSALHRPRVIFPDNFIMCPTHVFLQWFNLYKNLTEIVNNKQVEESMKTFKENFLLNIEEYILMSYIHKFDIKNVVYHPMITNAI